MPDEPAVTDLPAYDDLPPAPEGGRCGWGLFGPDDNVGLFNLLTPERIVAAARLIRLGRVFPLDAPIDAFLPPIAHTRGAPRHTVLHQRGAISFDDVYDNFFPQGSSQWDSLGHFAYTPGTFYNGASEDDIWSGRRNTIEHWARRGIAGRAVVFDMARTLADAGRPYDPGSSRAFTVDELELARVRTGLELQPGDILIVHTGFAAWFQRMTAVERDAFRKNPSAPGLAPGEDMCRYLWNSHIAAVASDTFAVEAFPIETNTTTGFLHRMLIPQFGMALGELWWTEDLAAACAEEGVHEVFLTSMPMHAPGGIGSPPNALALM